MKQIKKIIRLAFPAMMENLLQMLMGVVDNYLVAQVGLIAVSGVSVANNIITIYQAIFIALGAAVSSLVAKSLGEKNAQKSLHYQSESLLVTFGLSLVLGLVSLGLGKRILTWLGTDAAVTQAGGLYLSIVGGLIVSLGLMTTLSSFLRALGKPQLPMYISLLTNVLNAVLSAVAVFILHWGIVGVACSTVLARLVGTLLLASQLPIKKIIKNIRWTLDRDLIKIALPAAGERLMMRAGDVVIVAIIVKFGTEVVAGNAIGETLTQFNYMPGMGMATATVILVAHSLGQKNIQEIKQLIKESYLISVALMLLVGATIYFSGGYLTHLFTSNQAALDASLVVLFYSFVGGPATAGTLIFTAAWQGLGNAKLPFYATTFGMWVIRIISGYVLGVSLHLGLTGVWLATVADNVFRWIFLYILYKKYMNSFQESTIE